MAERRAKRPWDEDEARINSVLAFAQAKARSNPSGSTRTGAKRGRPPKGSKGLQKGLSRQWVTTRCRSGRIAGSLGAAPGRALEFWRRAQGGRLSFGAAPRAGACTQVGDGEICAPMNGHAIQARRNPCEPW